MKRTGLIACLLLSICLSAQAEFAQLGPVESLDNGAVTLDVALRVGRIVSFHRTNEPDWLVVHDEAPTPGWNWNPWGGDRMWPTSQSLNYQIYRNKGFDPVIDGKPWELITKTATSLEMRSGVSPELGLQVTHRIELVGNTAEVLHTYRLTRLLESPFPVHVWTVTGVRAVDYMLMESDPRVGHEGYQPYRQWTGSDFKASPSASLVNGTRVLQVHPPKADAMKLGTYGRWIASVSGHSAFWQGVRYLPDQVYIDACNLEAFISRDTETHELETLSPTWFLAKGETREWSVRWRLLDFPDDVKSPEAKAVFLHALAEESESPR